MADFYAELPINDQDHRQLSRHGRVRERRRAAAAHRHAERRRASPTTRARWRWTPIAKTFRYLDEEEIAKQRAAAKDAKDKAQEMKRVGLHLRACGRAPRRAAAARATRILRAWMAGAGQGRQGQARSAAADQAVRAVRLQRVRPARSVQAAQDRAGQGRQQARAGSQRGARSRSKSYPLESLHDGRHARSRARRRTRWCARPDKDVYQVTAGNYLGQNFGVVTGIGDGEIKLKELVQDGAGDWTERSSTLQLLQADQRHRERRR